MKTLLLPLALVAGLVVSCGSTGTAARATDVVSSDALQVVDYDQRSHDLGAALAKGEPVVLVFWQTWCRSCLAEAPELARAATAHPTLHFVGVVPGDAETVDADEVREVAAATGMPYPQVLDRDLKLTRACGVKGTPTILVLGEGGRVLHESHRADLPWAELAR